ncbi:hypothetical protein CI109_106275 [Kwoniella shandongensis]|uniref:Zn(2)-C6 fungal-type domain-containing protein n=1 Tax=Kwoniella shandongensis TaxID=1734106 RepID=A0A5M6BVA6_9TREE|nr:uncharacterized protein CI109_006719 [Kwoniella shandongensis]KAA5524919.1 hypothetical protein CI109_006719 [Kwoniella shandongensis]
MHRFYSDTTFVPRHPSRLNPSHHDRPSRGLPIGVVQRGTMSMPTSPVMGMRKVCFDADLGGGGDDVAFTGQSQRAQETVTEQPQIPQHVSPLDIRLPATAGGAPTWNEINPCSPVPGSASTVPPHSASKSPHSDLSPPATAPIQPTSNFTMAPQPAHLSPTPTPTTALALGPIYDSDITTTTPTTSTSSYHNIVVNPDPNGMANVHSAHDQTNEDTGVIVGVGVEEEFGSGEGGRKKRVQVRNACTNCQRACKKCSNTRPCERCVKHGLDDCVDSTRKPRKTGVKRGPYKRRASKYDTIGPFFGKSYATSSQSAAGRLSHTSQSANQAHTGFRANPSVPLNGGNTNTLTNNSMIHGSIHTHLLSDTYRSVPLTQLQLRAIASYTHVQPKLGGAHLPTTQHVVPTYLPPGPRTGIGAGINPSMAAAFAEANANASSLAQALSAALTGPRWINGQRLDPNAAVQPSGASSAMSGGITTSDSANPVARAPRHKGDGGKVGSASRTTATTKQKYRIVTAPKPLYPKTSTTFPISLNGDKDDPFSRAVSPIRQFGPDSSGLELEIFKHKRGKEGEDGVPVPSPKTRKGSGMGLEMSEGQDTSQEDVAGHQTILHAQEHTVVTNAEQQLVQFYGIAQTQTPAISQSASATNAKYETNPTTTTTANTSTSIGGPPSHNFKIHRPSLRTLISHSTSTSRAPSPDREREAAQSPTLFDQPMNMDEVDLQLRDWQGWTREDDGDGHGEENEALIDGFGTIQEEENGMGTTVDLGFESMFSG